MAGSSVHILGGSSPEYLGNAFRECIIPDGSKPFFDKHLCCRLVSGYWDLVTGDGVGEASGDPVFISSKAILRLRAKDSHVP